MDSIRKEEREKRRMLEEMRIAEQEHAACLSLQRVPHSIQTSSWQRYLPLTMICMSIRLPALTTTLLTSSMKLLMSCIASHADRDIQSEIHRDGEALNEDEVLLPWDIGAIQGQRIGRASSMSGCMA